MCAFSIGIYAGFNLDLEEGTVTAKGGKVELVRINSEYKSTNTGAESLGAYLYWAMYAGKDWFADSVGFAVENGLMNGVSETEFAPRDNATRGEIAAILQRFIEASK